MSELYPPKRARKARKNESEFHSGALLRLAAAVLAFSVCFVAKTRLPRQTEGWRRQLSALIGTRTDLRESLTWLGEELEQERMVLQAVGDWCVDVFGAQDLRVPPAQTEPQQEAPAAEASLPEASAAGSEVPPEKTEAAEASPPGTEPAASAGP